MEYSGFGKKSGPSSSANPNVLFGNVSPPPQNPSSSIQRSPRPFVQSPPSFGGVQRPLGYNGSQSHWQRPSYSSTSIVPMPGSANSVSIKVSRPQQEISRNLNQHVPMRSNVSTGVFRPPTGGGLPIRQSVPPRTHTPDLAFSGNNRTVEGFRPARQLVRPRTNAPEQARTSNQFVDLDRSPPPPAGHFGHLARPEIASRNNQFFDLDNFPPLSVGVASGRHTARPRIKSRELAPGSHQFVSLDSFSNPVGPGPVRHVAPPQRAQMPEQTFNTDRLVEGFRSSSGAAPVRPVPLPHSFDGPARSPVSYASLEDIKDQPTVFPSYNSERSQFNNSRSKNQARSPDGSQFDANSRFPQNNSKRPALTHSPELDTTLNSNFGTYDSRGPRRPLPHSSNNVIEAPATNPTSLPVMKRSRSPPQRNLLSSNKATTNDNFNDIEDDEREMLAKAKRLARFKVELGENVESSNDDTELKVSTNLREPSIVGVNKIVPDHSTELNEDFSNELEDSRPPGVIIGVCTDMCPGMVINSVTRR